MAIKLTDTQRVILSHAATRETLRVLPVPKSLNKNAGGVALSVKPLIAKGLILEVPWTAGDIVWSEAEGHGKMTLVVSSAGLTAVGVELQSEPEPKSARQPKAGASRASASKSESASGPKAGSKLGILVELLSKKTGATNAEMMDATGWQAHSVRGALSGAIKKKLKLEITSDVEGERGRVYRIQKPVTAKVKHLRAPRK